MLTEDYLIRMINLAIAALLRIIGLKKEGDYQEALLLIDVTLEQLLGLRSSMVKNLDDNRLYFLLTRNDTLDTQRLAIVADLFHEEGDILAALGKAQESQADYARALRFDLEVLFNTGEEDPVDLLQKIDILVQKIDLQALGADTLWPLAGYYEERGAFDQAEKVLGMLAERPEIRAEIVPEVAAFSERLVAKGILGEGEMKDKMLKLGE